MSGNVKGVLFVDYVRMLKACKDVDWRAHLSTDDFGYLSQRITPDGWYPMHTFERFGLAILDQIVGGNLAAVHTWGKLSVDQLHAAYEGLLAANDPRESLMRFQVLRGSFFDFEAVTVHEIYDIETRLRIAYGMSPRAEEAASHQTMGFFERLIEIAGGRNINARFERCSWKGDADTLLVVSWDQPGGV
jgi:hypothetical protein